MESDTPRPTACPHCGADLDAAVFAASGEPRCPRCDKSVRPKPAGSNPLLMKLAGVGITAIGAGTMYYYLYLPWRQIEEMAPKISLSLKASFGGPLLLGLGLAFLLPDRPKEGETESFPRRFIRKLVLVIMLGGSIGGLAAYFWLRSLARSRGYEF